MKHYFIALISLLAVLSSCAKFSLDKSGVSSAYIEVTGCVYALNAGLPLSDIDVTLYSYDADDHSMKYPLEKFTAVTDDAGDFVIKAYSESMRDTKFQLKAKDVMRGEYAESSMPVNVSVNGATYDKNTGTYHISGCDFYLLPAAY